MGDYEPVRESVPQLDLKVTITSPARSFCPNCLKQLSWHHTVPILSWIALKGRCAFCSKRISIRYPIVEIVTGILATLCYLRFGATLSALVAFAVICSLIVITIIDIDYMIIPNKITYPGTIFGFALALASSFLPPNSILPLAQPFTQSIGESIVGVVLGGGTLYAIWWFYLVVRKREGLGLGDVKLLTMLGAIFGYQCAVTTIFIGSLFGSFAGIIMLLAKRHSFSSYLSFGPYLVLAAVLHILNLPNLYSYLSGSSASTIWRVLQ
jgi:leader peptidase (prepilin peptidase)/N-methyltransferase